MVEYIIPRPKTAVGPKLFDLKTGAYTSFLTPGSTHNTYLTRLLYWIINDREGYQPGRIGISGINMGIPETPDDWENVEWLPGGCMLHHKEHLVLFDYYPFKGKAYLEDLFHSNLLRKEGVTLFRCGTSSCDVDFSSNSSFTSFFKDYIRVTRLRKIFLREKGSSFFRLFCYQILDIIIIVIRKVKYRIPKNKYKIIRNK